MLLDALVVLVILAALLFGALTRATSIVGKLAKFLLVFLALLAAAAVVIYLFKAPLAGVFYLIELWYVSLALLPIVAIAFIVALRQGESRRLVAAGITIVVVSWVVTWFAGSQ